MAFAEYSKALRLLAPANRRKYILIVFVQLFASILDLVAIASLGVLTLLATSSTNSGSASGFIYSLLDLCRRFAKDEESLTLLLAVAAISLFFLRSLFSLYFNGKTLRFLSNQSSEISTMLFNRFTTKSILFIQSKSTQQMIASLNIGVTNAVLGILGSFSILFSEGSLLALLTVGLFVISPKLTVFIVIYFLVIVFVLQRVLSSIGLSAGRLKTNTDIKSAEIIQESISSFREIYVANRFNYIQNQFNGVRKKGSIAIADYQFLTLVPKYVMELSLILGASLLAIAQLLQGGKSEALFGLVIFLAAGSRILPSILRIQNAFGAIQNAVGSAEQTFQLFRDLVPQDSDYSPSTVEKNEPVLKSSNQSNDLEFNGSIEIKSVEFTYPMQLTPAIKDLSLRIDSGDSIAIVGVSGAGKSTLTDLILGLLVPQVGTITVSGLDPVLAIQKWPGSIGYVPQAIGLLNGTIRENVAIGRNLHEINDDQVWNALDKAHLGTFVRAIGNNLDSKIGERGVKLSGGQRQRLGLARALYSNPKILILDEATSALDAETENAIINTLSNLAGDVTIITIAHRLATIRNAKAIIYLEDGRVLAKGTFQEVRSTIPQFDIQAKLLGL